MRFYTGQVQLEIDCVGEDIAYNSCEGNLKHLFFFKGGRL
jgi:hypothetical protein